MYLFTNNIPKDKSIWLLALQFFISELKEVSNDEEKYFFFKNAISLFLIKLLENEIFSSLNILEIINEINCDIPLFLIQNFYLKAIEKENDILLNKLTKSKNYDANHQDIDDELYILNYVPVPIKIDKCEQCKQKINMPCIIFKCKHIYHSSCVNENIKDNYVHCPKCIININDIDKNLSEANDIYKNINSIEGLQNELNKKNDIIEFIDELYGNGSIGINLNK